MPRLSPVLLALLPFLTGFSHPSPQHDDPLTSKARRRTLAGLVDDVARVGRPELVERLNELLLALGETPVEQGRREDAWRRGLEAAPEAPDARRARKLARRLAAQADKLTDSLDQLDPERARELARLVLELDAANEAANAALGHARGPEGWTTERARTLEAGGEALESKLTAARRLEVPVEVGPSDNPAARLLLGDEASCGTWGPFEIHLVAPEAVVRRRLASIVQGAALMESLVHDRPIALPSLTSPRPVVLCTESEQFERAVADALLHERVSPNEARLMRSTRVASFHDLRGWTVLQPDDEPRALANCLWLLRLQIVGYHAQPALSDGLLNWISLQFAGAPKAVEYWRTGGAAPDRSVARRDGGDDVLWHVAGSSMAGCREWVRLQLESGRSFRFARSLVARTGQLEAEQLLVATVVTEYLLTSGRFSEVLARARGSEDRGAVMEAALGTTLLDLDSEWTAWLLDDVAAGGLVQALEHTSDPDPIDPAVLGGLERLREIRRRAFEGLAACRPVQLLGELSAGAAAHARYLVLNPDQRSTWPDIHQERPDSPGFSIEGIRAAHSSVVAFGCDPTCSIDAWMATFYHRLPLLERYLYGVGIGSADDVVVMDTGSMSTRNHQDEWVVWPPRDGQGLPRHFAPELPNPVPGEDQSSWGYPITLQFGHGDPNIAASFELTLTDADGESVACWTIRPDAPYSTELVPPDAWCLIPKAALEADQRYSVTALRTDTGDRETWSFETGR